MARVAEITASSTAGGGAVARTREYLIARGDTLGQLARKFGTSVGTLAKLNGITNPDRIFAGAILELPTETNRSHTVVRGDTLSAIARGAGLSLAKVLDENPQIRNPDRIYPGDRVKLPDQGPEIVPTLYGFGRSYDPITATYAPITSSHEPFTSSHEPIDLEPMSPIPSVAHTAFTGETLTLTSTDILNIKKTLQTEWVQWAGEEQAHGIIDTILNRVAADLPRWGDTVAEVVNAHNQFSDINGPVSRRAGRNSVEQFPAARISARVDQLVDSYLAERAAGRQSSIGSHLNYANPIHSDRVNREGWIRTLQGPLLGRGDAIHRHGTTPELDHARPEPFAIALPETERGLQPSPSQPFDGRLLAAEAGVAVKSDRVNISSLHPSMGPAILAVAAAAESLRLPQPVITSGNDSRHSAGSLHYQDRALDFRGNNISDQKGFAFQHEVSRILGQDYDVIFETFANAANDHLHVEFDPV